MEEINGLVIPGGTELAFKEKGGETLSGSTGYTVKDSVEYPLVGLKVFGKSTQDGTPTPDNPVPIVSVENPTVEIKKDCILVKEGDEFTELPDSVGNGFIVLADVQEGYVNGSLWIGFFDSNKNRITNYSCYNGNFTNPNKNQLTYRSIYNYSLYTNAKYVKITSVIDGCKIRTYVKKTVLSGDAQKIVNKSDYIYSLPISNTLNAIPVSSGGNVTIDGQEYIADYVDFERGKLVKCVEKQTIDGTTGFSWQHANKSTYQSYYVYGILNKIPKKVDSNFVKTVSTKFIGVSHNIGWGGGIGNSIAIHENIDNKGLFIVPALDEMTVDEFREWVRQNPFDVIYPLETQEIIDLSESELQAYRQLQTYNGVTNISNDKGAGVEINYCTSKLLSDYALPLLKNRINSTITINSDGDIILNY